MSTIKSAYLTLIEERGYTPDPKQLEVVAAYDRLKARLDKDEATLNQERLSTIERLFKPFMDLSHACEYEDPRGLYIYGRVGRGKTFLMDLFFDNISQPKIREHYYHFMQDVHQKMQQVKGHEDPLKMVAKAYAKECKVLCVDEFHVIDITDAMILYRLLEALLDEGIFFITTSNRTPDDLYKNGLQRQQFLPAIEIIKERLEVIPLDTEQDYRMRHLESADVWFTGDLEEQITHFEEQCESLIGIMEGPETIDLNGHPFTLLKHGEDAAWFTFEEACVKARASHDFIKLAATYETIFLSGLPQLTRKNEDAARRFVIMVDEFYDQGVKLIIGSEATIETLYAAEGEKAIDFEFDRTISRLIEMQSQEYLDQPKRD